MPEADKIRRMTGEVYLAQAETAARHSFNGIGNYLERFPHIHSSTEARTQEELALDMKELEDWSAGQFSLGVLCGGILQLAAQGLEMCSTNGTIPPSCAALVEQKNG